jgi:hypothetical protein
VGIIEGKDKVGNKKLPLAPRLEINILENYRHGWNTAPPEGDQIARYLNILLEL